MYVFNISSQMLSCQKNCKHFLRFGTISDRFYTGKHNVFKNICFQYLFSNAFLPEKSVSIFCVLEQFRTDSIQENMLFLKNVCFQYLFANALLPEKIVSIFFVFWNHFGPILYRKI